MQTIDQHLTNIDAALPVVQTPESSKEAKARRRHARGVAARRFATLQRHQSAVEVLRPLPGRGESLHLVTDGAFSTWSLATAAVELLAVPVTQAVISTLGINRDCIASLCELLDDKKILRVTLNLSNYFAHSDRAVFFDTRRDIEARGGQIGVTRAHAKIVLLATADGQRVCIEGSGNMRSSMNWEQYHVADDAALFDFHAGWILKLMKETPCPPIQ